jgi:hypothetical protein
MKEYLTSRDISGLGFQPRRTDYRMLGLMDKVYDMNVIEEADAEYCTCQISYLGLPKMKAGDFRRLQPKRPAEGRPTCINTCTVRVST